MLGSPCQGPRSGLTPPISTTCPAHLASPSGLASAPLSGSQRGVDQSPTGAGPAWGVRFQPTPGGPFSTGLDTCTTTALARKSPPSASDRRWRESAPAAEGTHPALRGHTSSHATPVGALAGASSETTAAPALRSPPVSACLPSPLRAGLESHQSTHRERGHHAHHFRNMLITHHHTFKSAGTPEQSWYTRCYRRSIVRSSTG